MVYMRARVFYIVTLLNIKEKKSYSMRGNLYQENFQIVMESIIMHLRIKKMNGLII